LFFYKNIYNYYTTTIIIYRQKRAFKVSCSKLYIPLRVLFCYNLNIMPKKLIIKKWDKYNKLTIIKEVEKKKSSRYFRCKCECWNIKDIRLWNLTG